MKRACPFALSLACALFLQGCSTSSTKSLPAPVIEAPKPAPTPRSMQRCGTPLQLRSPEQIEVARKLVEVTRLLRDCASRHDELIEYVERINAP